MKHETDHASDATIDALDMMSEANRRCPGHVRNVVRDLLRSGSRGIVEALYDGLEATAEGPHFLPGPERRDRIAHLFGGWLDGLFTVETQEELAAFVAHQKQIGEVHARISLPAGLLIRAMRILRREFMERLAGTDLDKRDTLLAAEWIAAKMDAARALILTSFIDHTEQSARLEEAYRLFALTQNLQVERERQRAELVEWSHAILMELHRPVPRYLPTIGASEFGLWFRHKGRVMFEDVPEAEAIEIGLSKIDEQILPRLVVHRLGDGIVSDAATDPVTLLSQEITALRFHLNTAFERHIEVENGRDTLTRLLTRRFAPIVLGREIALARSSSDRNFALALVDIDDFKRVNDLHGHSTGDAVLQQVAATMLNCRRGGDFVFRWGGEEFLICLTEITADQGHEIAETLRRRVAETPIQLADGKTMSITASIGLAHFDGHPDYQNLVSRADEALYRAKRNGRNRVELG